MNGFPLVILGIAFFALAYILWKIQGKIGEIIGAVDQGFKAIEDGVNQNILSPTGAFSGVTNSVDQSFQTIENGLNQNILGPGGILDDATTALNAASSLFNQAGTEIQAAQALVATDILQVINDSEKTLSDVESDLTTATNTLNTIGNDIDVDIFGTHPLSGVAQPFFDVANTVQDVNNDCVDASNELAEMAVHVQAAAGRLNALSTDATNLANQFAGLSQYTGTTFRNGVSTSVTDLEKARISLDQFFSTFRSGVSASVTELEAARTYLDSQLLLLVSKNTINALAVAGVVLIIIGVSIGL